MIVGFMRNFRNPPQLTKLLAKLSKYNGIELVYFNASNIDIERKVIKGKILVDDKWIKKEVPVPMFIDVSRYCFKHKDEIRFLQENSTLSTGKLGSKDVINEKIVRDGQFSKIIIPTDKVSTFSNFIDFLVKYNKIVMKPRNGHKGQGIYILSSIDNDTYSLGFEKSENQLNTIELQEFFEKKLKDSGYILQKCINSRNSYDDPFDCRVRLEKNGKGEWEVAKYFIRIGIGQKVVSNISQGGGISELDPFLKANFGDNWEAIKNSIEGIGISFPYKLEKLFDVNLTSLALDLGIDRDNGSIYLFETNNAPGYKTVLGEVAMLRSDYYKYIFNEISKNKTRVPC
ncbi:YheC/YheD family protein [Alkalihalobacterium chitinilyticum]|uniref:YheC/YheD family protein n=1 Tax=Alkalihalobacterium chitinilyticum TaxID=2980103 RepID=A0ABT5VK88_9BACI|nr:YheC/YheD family protein [Alkalihalobacterium chitinilyticum]MDE5415824.1 YheC/YheD family protein [Alkalihalobacterium chitinilyticum]